MSKEISLKDRILRFLKHNPIWHAGGEIEKLAMNAGYQGSTAKRELNYLVEEGKIRSELRKGRRAKIAWYAIKN